ncbi:putative Down Syndrome cell adhesion molecule protein 1 [Daphnia magna]|uniref:Putative Down Syndrome cell adhesion molecule protein 1 n=4 Tax=Daphnia TaxID=6668 RepID=A0A162T4Q6_9CRUS|nr:putative Down Syndrome cell adhesion molecule protein 1 [Daphnia magna]
MAANRSSASDRFLVFVLTILAFYSGACVGDGSATAAASSSSLSGPVFLKEPSNRIDFSNTTGTVVECAATGNPRPEILWIKADGSPVTDVPGLRQVNNRKQPRFKTSKNIRRKYDVVFLNTLTMLVESPAFSPALLCLLPVQTSGSLVFPPFRAEDYKQEVHAQFYRCVARNSAGSIVSRDIHVRAGNHFPILSFPRGSRKRNDVRWLVVLQSYSTYVSEDHVILGNAAILRCHIPSFVADTVHVDHWLIDENIISSTSDWVVSQEYDTDVNKEYVIRGNSALIKCQFPSFMADHLQVESWIIDDGTVINHSELYVVSQEYDTDASKEYVIRGNSALLKCQFPSFMADHLQVESWMIDDGTIVIHSERYVVHQTYQTDVNLEHVIRGNSAVLKCSVPSFIADFVTVDTWLIDDNHVVHGDSFVVQSSYVIEVNNEHVILGNSAMLKCTIPSFVTDFVHVASWTILDERGELANLDTQSSVVLQSYESEVGNEYVIRGNSALLKCGIPSYVADLVQVAAWLDDHGQTYHPTDTSSAVWQDYEVRVNDEFVLRGNAALLKCLVPSYVSDVVQIESWTSGQGEVFGGTDWVVSQSYQVHVHDEYVLLGNAGLLRCLIPSFVSDFVIVDTWVGGDGTHITADSHGIDLQKANVIH